VLVPTGSFEGDHLTIVGTVGIQIDDSASSVAITSSILDVSMVATGNTALLTTQDILTQDHQFVEAAVGDYRLQASSPARGAGPEGVDIGAIPYADPLAGLGTTIRWRTEDSPFHLTADATVPVGFQLQIDPGVHIYVDPGVTLTVEGTLKILGTEHQRVRFSHHPEAGIQDDPLLPGIQLGAPKWAGVRLTDSLSSENIIQYADFINAQPLNNQGSVGVIRSECLIDHCTFSGTHYRMVYGRNCSLTVQYCTFPDMFAPDEDPVALRLDNVAEQLKVESADFPEIQNDPRFLGGFPVGGHFRVYHNEFFGNKGHNDVFDADGGRWGVSPVLDCRYNHFHGPVEDEHIDLGGDAYIAFNTFEKVDKDKFTSDRGYANAISTGDRGSGTTVVVAGNVFRNVDHAINCKVNTGTIFEHNTCLDFNRDYSYSSGAIQQDVLCSAVNLFVPEDFNPTPGDGAYMGFNVFYGSEFGLFTGPSMFPRLISWADRDQAARPAKTSRVQFYHNLIDPNLLDDTIGSRHSGGVYDPSWGEGNVMGAPGSREAAFDLPFGAEIAEWAYIEDGPRRGSASSEATFVIGGPGIFAYRWRLNNGEWTEPISIAPDQFPRNAPTVRTHLLEIQDLLPGNQRLEVIGQDFAGNWQPEDAATAREWTVAPNWSDVVLNEIRTVGEDTVELHNLGDQTNLAGWKLAESEDDNDPYIFTEDNSTMDRDGFMVLNEVTLDKDGDRILFIDPDGNVKDEIRFGHQIEGYTLGRFAGEWTLTEDTIGTANTTPVLGEPSKLHISEALATGEQWFRDDWIELHNPTESPISLDGLRLTDNPYGDPTAHVFEPHTYIAAMSYLKLIADGSKAEGHVNFSLDGQGESLALTDPQGEIIDLVLITPQTDDQSISWQADGTPSYPAFPTDGFAASNEEIDRMRGFIDHLRVSEILYKPTNGSDDEFIELTNTGETALDLTGVRFTRGISFTFPEYTLEPGAYVILAKNAAALTQRFPADALPIAGEYGGKLDNSGESLTLTLPEPFGAAILDFRYEPIAQEGHSIELTDLTTLDWQSSPSADGNPADAQSGGVAPPENYHTWAAKNNITNPNSDTYNDGLPALLEYVLGGDPTIKDALNALTVSPSEVILTLAKEDVSLIYVIEESFDLKTWQPLAELLSEDGWPPKVTSLSLPNGKQQITVPLNDAPRPRFVRLVVSIL
jgi:hypothetical protein